MGAPRRIYVSGPMTGYEEMNYPRFNAVCQELRAKGYEVVSPHEVPPCEGWDGFLRADLREMLTCEAVVQIEGWEASRGARLEAATAIQVGMPVIPLAAIDLFRT